MLMVRFRYEFGSSVSISTTGDVIVGAYYNDGSNPSNSG